MPLPGTSLASQVSTRSLTPEDWEEAFCVFRMDVYKEDARARRLFQQRTVLVSARGESHLKGEIRRIVDQMNELDPERQYHCVLTPAEEFYAEKEPTVPFDSALITAYSPLVLAKRSPKTGKIYHDITMQLCPHTGAKLAFFITRRPSE